MKKGFNWKSLVSFFLSCVICLNFGAYAVAVDVRNKTQESSGGAGGEFSVKGIDYFSGMEVVTNVEQLNHQLLINSLSVQGNKLLCDATLTLCDSTSENISFTGTVYHSENTFCKARDGLTVLVDSSTGDWNVESFSLIRRAGTIDLFPANASFDGLPAMKLVLQQKTGEDRTVLFEGLLPQDFNYDSFFENAVTAAKNNSDMTTRSGEGTAVDQGSVHAAENWLESIKDDENIPYYNGDSLGEAFQSDDTMVVRELTKIVTSIFWMVWELGKSI